MEFEQRFLSPDLRLLVVQTNMIPILELRKK